MSGAALAGYSGAGFLIFPATGGSATFTNIDGASGGTKTLTLRFANGNPTPRTGVLKINGVPQRITFKLTGSYDTWTTMQVQVPLAAGRTNTIQLESSGQSLAYIDELTVL